MSNVLPTLFGYNTLTLTMVNLHVPPVADARATQESIEGVKAGGGQERWLGRVL